MTSTAQVGVIGAGPAGARVAELLARRGVDVLLLDPKAPWEKPCGGGLTPAVFEDFPDLMELYPIARSLTEVRVELQPELGFSVHLDRPLRIVPRQALGAWQLERAVNAGAWHVPSRVRTIERGAPGWTLETDERRFRIRFLIGADGAASLVRRVAAPELSVELAPTRVAYPSSAGLEHDRVVLKFYPRIAGYLWDFPRPGHRSVGVGVQSGTWTRPDLDQEIDDYRRSRDHCSCLGLPRAGAVIGTGQLGHGDFSCLAGAGFALLGDAAGLADPLTGEGIHNAMRSAELLARAWSRHGADDYPKLAHATFAREFGASRFARRVLLESWLGSALIHRCLSSNSAYAVMHSILNGVNEHDGSMSRLFGRALRAWSAVRMDRTLAARGGRDVAPCSCASVELLDHAVTATGICGDAQSPRSREASDCRPPASGQVKLNS